MQIWKKIKANLSAIRHPHNWHLCRKYPFLKVYNVWSQEFIGYQVTWYDFIAYGWQVAFGKELLNDLKQAMQQDNSVFRFYDIKEKYGTLSFYTNGHGEHVDQVLNKYELLSMCYCNECGQPVRYVTRGWINYKCENCFLKYMQRLGANVSQETLKECHVSENDLPEISTYVDGQEHTVNITERYGINIAQIWGLKK